MKVLQHVNSLYSGQSTLTGVLLNSFSKGIEPDPGPHTVLGPGPMRKQMDKLSASSFPFFILAKSFTLTYHWVYIYCLYSVFPAIKCKCYKDRDLYPEVSVHCYNPFV